MKRANPLLSEFAGFRIYRLLHRDYAQLGASLLTAAAALLIIALTMIAGVACATLRIKESSPLIFCFGYLAELNYGPASLLIMPFFVGSALAFVWLSSDALHELATGSHLRVVPSGDAIALVAKRNRTAFRVIVPVAAVLGAALVVVPEIRSLHKPIVGWVQAPYLKAHSVDQLQMASSSSFSHSHAEIQLSTRATPGPRYYLALFAALSFESAFVAFVIWIFAKIVFLLVLLYKAFRAATSAMSRRQQHPELAFRLNCLDEHNYRFGLSSLDKAYDEVAVVCLLAAFQLVTQFLSNASKGTWYFAGNAEFVGQVLTFTAILVILVLLWFLPAYIFRLMTRRECHSALMGIAKRESSATTDHERSELERQKKIVNAQRAWPAGDKKFLLITPIVFALLGVVLGFSPRNDLIKNALELAGRLPEVLCRCR